MKLLVLALILTVGASSALAEIYTWKDAKGTVFYTNSLHEIPARYLKRARLLDVATGKAGPPVAASAPDQANAAQPLPSVPAVAAPADSSAPAPERRSYESRRSSRNSEARRAERRRGRE